MIGIRWICNNCNDIFVSKDKNDFHDEKYEHICSCCIDFIEEMGDE